jgi:putative transposase
MAYHDRKTPRNSEWNYSSAASYFITIYCHNREFFFGEIVDGEMIKTELGKQAEIEWLKSMSMHENLKLSFGDFVVMPDHFHGIVTIGQNKFIWNNQKRFGPQSKNLGSIIKGFKAALTRFANNNKMQFEWGSRYHDKVIRNKEEYDRISKYIRENPKNWKKGRGS